LQFDKDEDIVTRLMVWGESLVSNVRKKCVRFQCSRSVVLLFSPSYLIVMFFLPRLARMPSKNLALPQYDTRMPRTVTEMEQILRKRPMMGKVLKYFMTSLDNITSAPFVYLCKKADPISIHRAVSYISNNEMTNLIYVVHFVDDRKAIRLRHAFLSKAQQQVRGWVAVCCCCFESFTLCSITGIDLFVSSDEIVKSASLRILWSCL
jgi:hypothetical protein